MRSTNTGMEATEVETAKASRILDTLKKQQRAATMGAVPVARTFFGRRLAAMQ
jgi:hypothetical protein